MSEIAKLYENAGVKKLLCCDICNAQEHALGLCAETKCEPLYPPFTAEKQIELIKWLGELDMLEILRTTREDKAWIINSEYGMSGNVYEHASRMKSFEEALAGLINSLWQELTEVEQEHIRRILNE